MDLLVSPLLIEKYINSCQNIRKSDEEKILSLIFENKFNRFILNKKLLELYENQFPPQSSELDLFQTQFVELINERGISKSSLKENMKEILIETEENYFKGKLDKEIYLNLSLNSDDSVEGNFSAHLSKIGTEKLKDNLYYNLAATNPNPVTFWHYDFTSDKQIENLFENVYTLITFDDIDIFDSYTNLTHPYYNPILNKGYKFNYYTANMSSARKRPEKIETNRELISFFKRVFIYRAYQPRYIHERRIKFNNLSIEINNDLANVLVSEPTWKIDLYVCNKMLSEVDKKKQFFDRDTDK